MLRARWPRSSLGVSQQCLLVRENTPLSGLAMGEESAMSGMSEMSGVESTATGGGAAPGGGMDPEKKRKIIIASVVCVVVTLLMVALVFLILVLFFQRDLFDPTEPSDPWW